MGGMPFESFDKEEFESFYKAFFSMESFLDSNGRELLAILYALRSFWSLIQGKNAKLYTDSKNASIIAPKGSRSRRLQRQALEIFQFCAVNNMCPLISCGSLGRLMNMLIP